MFEGLKLIELINIKEYLEKELDSIIYGSVEVRESNNKKVMYTHFRDDGILYTKYIGEYSEELCNLISINNEKAKDLKKELKKVNKELKSLGYIDEILEKNILINIDFARRYLVETIYDQAILEGVVTSLSETEKIIEGGKIHDMTATDVMKVVNLKHAWDFILNKNILAYNNPYSICTTINRLIEEGFYFSAGILRTTPVSIGGTNWKPDFPIENKIKEDLENLFSSEDVGIDKAIDILLYVTRNQLFIDGNKRTSVIFSNYYLISHGLGLIVIPSEKAEMYKLLLVEYYETNNDESIREFLKDFCYKKIK